MLQGRDPETRRISALVRATHDGGGSVLMLHGPPGIGKTALLSYAERCAGDLTVLRVSGYEAEVALPFAALRQLLAPVVHLRDRLPAVQAQALGSALGLDPPSPQVGVAVPMAILSVLHQAAAEQPVCVIVDDLQWLDPATRDALLFVARRLGHGAVSLLIAGREPIDRSGVPMLEVTRLDEEGARAILDGGGNPLAAPVRDAIVDAAEGNPLALVELSAGLRPEQRTGAVPLDVPLRPGPLLHATFAQRLERLDAVERRAIEVAAAMENGPLSWLVAALDVVGISADATDAAERDGMLIVRDGQVALSHSVLRAVVYHAMDQDDRRAAHRALAATAADAPRRAWHLASAAVDADEGIAVVLDAAAERSRAVGGHAEAAAAYVRAAELSGTAGDRGRRELAAAQDFAVAGDLDRAIRLLDGAEARVVTADRPAVERLRGNLAMRRGDPDGAYRTLAAAGERCLEDGNHAAAAELFLEASVAPMMTGDVALQAAVVDRARVASRPIGGALQTLADLVAGEILVVSGQDAAGDAALAAACERIDDLDLVEHGEIAGMAAQTSVWVGSFERATTLVERMVDAGRAARALGRLPYPLTVRAQLAFRQGQWTDAERDIADAVQLARDSGQETVLSFALSVRARLAAARGAGADARNDIEESLRITDREQAAGIAVHTHAACALVELVDGAFDAAVEAAQRAQAIEATVGLRQPAAAMWAGELIEGLVAGGRTEAGAAAVDALRAQADASGSLWAQMVAARGAVMLAPDADIDTCAAFARSCAALATLPWERARTELAIGERLRRAQRRTDAHEPLGRALAGFEQLGAAAFVDRARVGCDAPGPTTADPTPVLTDTERRIVRLVAEGRTNRELAADLHLGQKTLERRLSALYRKLGVSSRTSLARFDRACEP